MTFGVEMATEALASLMSQTQPTAGTTTVPQHEEDEDYFVRIDALLLRDLQGRAFHQTDHRSARLYDLSTNDSLWRRTSAASDLDNWTSQIREHDHFIRRVAALNRPIVTLRTGTTVHTGHLSGLLGVGILITRSWIWLRHL